MRTLDQQIERQTASEDLRRSGGTAARHAVDDQGSEHLILQKQHKLADRHPPRGGEPLDIAKALRGLLTTDWTGAEMEQRAMSVGSLPGGGYTVPAELSAMWIDMARAKAVCIAAGAGTIPMESR